MADAAFWYQRAAEQVWPDTCAVTIQLMLGAQGYARAQFAFALLLAEGRGLPTDLQQSVHFHRQAAQQVI